MKFKSRIPFLLRDGSPIQASHRREGLLTESTSKRERGVFASQNLRKGEKLLFVPPYLVMSADSVSLKALNFFPVRSTRA